MSMVIEKTLTVKDVPSKDPCVGCDVCLRLRLMELGVITGQKLRIKEVHKELWTVSVLDENGTIGSTIAMRQDELDRILFEEIGRAHV